MPQSNPKRDGRPHILLITMDELRKDALSCYGGRAVRTTHLDALAAESHQFDAAYTVSPLCLPARCALLTGLYPHRSGAYSNFRPCALRPELPNLYHGLRAAGYRTAHVGKCHYAPVPYGRMSPDAVAEWDTKDFFLSLGLDHLDLQDGKGGSANFWNDYSRELDAAGLLAPYRELIHDKARGKVFTFPGPAEWHPDAWVGRKTCEYLDACSPEQAQFLWVSFSGPHYPFDPPAEFLDRVDRVASGSGLFREGEWNDPGKIQSLGYNSISYDGCEGCVQAPGGARNAPEEYWRKLRHYYFANVALIDDWIGRLLAAAARRLGSNVLVVFTTDHGEMLGNHHLWGKNHCAYEDVMNIPLLVRFPGAPPQRTGARVELVDLLPTCLNAAGAPLPEQRDGRDLRAWMQEGGRRIVIGESESLLTAFDGRHRYIQVRRGQSTVRELHDLRDDPGEFVNAIGDPRYDRRIAELQGVLLDTLADHCLG